MSNMILYCYQFQYDFIQLPKTMPFETKKGSIQQTKITEELFKAAADLGVWQHAWNGESKVTILLFDTNSRTARVQVDYTYSAPSTRPASEAGSREVFRSVLAAYCECPDTYDIKTGITSYFVHNVE